MNYENTREILKRTLAFDDKAVLRPVGDAIGDDGINPTRWEERAREFQRKVLVLTERAEQFDFTGSGTDYVVTIEADPEKFEETAEDDPTAVQEYDGRQVKFDPKEYTSSMEVSRQHMARSFIGFMDRFAVRLGYGSGDRKDKIAADVLYAGASETVFANGKANRAALEAGDILSPAELRKVRAKMQRERYVPVDFIITPEQEEQLTSNTNVSFADRYGGAEAIRGGMIGQLVGWNIIVAHSAQLAESGAVSKAIALGETQRGEKAFGYAIKRPLMIESEYVPKYRKFALYGHEEYDFKVLHPKAVKIVESHNAFEGETIET